MTTDRSADDFLAQPGHAELPHNPAPIPGAKPDEPNSVSVTRATFPSKILEPYLGESPRPEWAMSEHPDSYVAKLRQQIADLAAENARLRQQRDAALARAEIAKREYDSLHALWEQAAEIVHDDGDEFTTDQDVLDAIQLKDDIAANDQQAMEAGRAWHKLRQQLDEAHRELREIGEVLEDYGGRYAFRVQQAVADLAEAMAQRDEAREMLKRLGTRIGRDLGMEPITGEDLATAVDSLTETVLQAQNLREEYESVCGRLNDADRWALDVCNEWLIDPVADWIRENGAYDPNLDDALGLRLGAIWGLLRDARSSPPVLAPNQEVKLDGENTRWRIGGWDVAQDDDLPTILLVRLIPAGDETAPPQAPEVAVLRRFAALGEAAETAVRTVAPEPSPDGEGAALIAKTEAEIAEKLDYDDDPGEVALRAQRDVWESTARHLAAALDGRPSPCTECGGSGYNTTPEGVGYDACDVCAGSGAAEPSTTVEAEPVRDEGGETVVDLAGALAVETSLRIEIVGVRRQLRESEANRGAAEQRAQALTVALDTEKAFHGAAVARIRQLERGLAEAMGRCSRAAQDVDAAEQRVRDLEQQLTEANATVDTLQTAITNVTHNDGSMSDTEALAAYDQRFDVLLADLEAIRTQGEALAQRMHDADPLNRRADRVYARELRALLGAAPTPPDGDSNEGSGTT